MFTADSTILEIWLVNDVRRDLPVFSLEILFSNSKVFQCLGIFVIFQCLKTLTSLVSDIFHGNGRHILKLPNCDILWFESF